MLTLLLLRMLSWVPGSLGVCVWAVFAAFEFIVLVKVISFIFGFIFSFIEMLKP